MLRIKLVKSPIGHNPRNRATIEALGLSKVGQIVEKEDNSSIRGMIHKIHNLLIVEATDGSAPIVDALNPGSSSRMVNPKTHKLPTIAPAKKGKKK
jgi:large subunit ribosomal protein L30